MTTCRSCRERSRNPERESWLGARLSDGIQETYCLECGRVLKTAPLGRRRGDVQRDGDVVLPGGVHRLDGDVRHPGHVRRGRQALTRISINRRWYFEFYNIT